jgi:hypothetical protein
VAVRAVELVNMKVVESPTKAWEIATSEFVGEGSWGQKKDAQKMLPVSQEYRLFLCLQ